MAKFNPNQGYNSQSPIKVYSTDGTLLFEIDPINKVMNSGPALASRNIDPNMSFTIIGNVDNYWGMNIYNKNTTGTTVSANLILACQDNDPNDTDFVDFGCNGEGWNDPNYATFDANAGFAYSNLHNFYVGSAGTGTEGNLFFFTGGHNNKNLIRGSIDASGNWFMGRAALATNATNGFLNIPTCAGTPTGTPTTKTGLAPLVYDSTNNKLYVYNGSWKSVTLS